MTAEEIRKEAEHGMPTEYWLCEIAAQLAELNWALRHPEQIGEKAPTKETP